MTPLDRGRFVYIFSVQPLPRSKLSDFGRYQACDSKTTRPRIRDCRRRSVPCAPLPSRRSARVAVVQRVSPPPRPPPYTGFGPFTRFTSVKTHVPHNATGNWLHVTRGHCGPLCARNVRPSVRTIPTTICFYFFFPFFFFFFSNISFRFSPVSTHAL